MEASVEHQISFPTHLLSEHLAALHTSGRDVLACPVGVSRLGQGGREVLVARRALPNGLTLRLSAVEVFGPFSAIPGPAERVALLEVGRGALRGYARGWVLTEAGLWQPVSRLNLPGPGMFSLPLLTRESANPAQREGNETESENDSRWSRTAGALGSHIYARAAGLKVGVVGLGRLGSLLAHNLVRFGIRSIVVADPDAVETHNTAEGQFETKQVGIEKVHAWASQVALAYPETEVVPVAETVTSLKAVEALKSCDLLFSAPDQPGARLAAACLAAAYCRPLIDVGTRVHRQGATTMGADVRVVLPERCLLCCGSVANEAQGLRLLDSPDEEEWFAAFRDWQQERPGSLASLNMIASGIAMRMFEDFVAGRISSSLWCHAEFSAKGEIQVSYATPPSPDAVQFCGCLISGWGDAGLGHFTEILRRRNQTRTEPRL